MAYDELLKRVPPYSIEAEQACLGAMIFAPNLVPQIMEVLSEEDFFDEKHRIIFRAIYELFDSNQTVDAVTIAERLQAVNKLAQAGGQEYIARLYDSSFSISNAMAYVNIIINRSILRSLINASRRIIDLVYEGDMDNVEKICDESEKLIFDVTHRRLRTSYKLLNEIMAEALTGISKLKEHAHVYTGVPTGFTDFDDKTSGLQKGDLIVIAARPSMGKTAFVLSLARNAAVRSKKPVAFFSLEMSSTQLVTRLISSESEISSDKIRRGNLAQHEWEQLHAKISEISDYFHAGLKLYEARKWKEAASYFQQCLKVNENDIVSKNFLERCRRLTSNPPVLETWSSDYLIG